jgi:hypothetical protein
MELPWILPTGVQELQAEEKSRHRTEEDRACIGNAVSKLLPQKETLDKSNRRNRSSRCRLS